MQPATAVTVGKSTNVNHKPGLINNNLKRQLFYITAFFCTGMTYAMSDVSPEKIKHYLSSGR